MSERNKAILEAHQHTRYLYDPERKAFLPNDGPDGLRLQELSHAHQITDLPTTYAVLGESPHETMEILGASGSIQTTPERIARIARNVSYRNRTQNKRNRDRTWPNLGKEQIRYVVFHNTISRAFRTNTFAVLNYMLVPHTLPDGQVIVPSCSHVVPYMEMKGPDGKFRPEIFDYVTDNLVSFHAGVGEWHDSQGRVYKNVMNGYSVGIEVDNDGRTPISQVQFDMLVYLTIEYMRKGVPVENMIGHKDYAPGRKFDPQPITYLVRNVVNEAVRIKKILDGDPENPKPPSPDFTPGPYRTLNDGRRTNVRQNYKVADSQIALTLPPNHPLILGRTYPDGALVSGSRRWGWVQETIVNAKKLNGPGFIHASRLRRDDLRKLATISQGAAAVRQVQAELLQASSLVLGSSGQGNFREITHEDELRS